MVKLTGNDVIIRAACFFVINVLKICKRANTTNLVDLFSKEDKTREGPAGIAITILHRNGYIEDDKYHFWSLTGKLSVDVTESNYPDYFDTEIYEQRCYFNFCRRPSAARLRNKLCAVPWAQANSTQKWATYQASKTYTLTTDDVAVEKKVKTERRKITNRERIIKELTEAFENAMKAIGDDEEL